MTCAWISAGSGAAPSSSRVGLAVGGGVAQERLQQRRRCRALPAEQTIS